MVTYLTPHALQENTLPPSHKKPTSPVSHRIEEHPRCILAGSSLHKRHIVGRFDAHHGKQFHEKPRHRTVFCHNFKVLRHGQWARFVSLPFHVGMGRFQATRAESRTLQADSSLHQSEALAALMFR